MARILLVDDEEIIVSLVRHVLRDEGHEVLTAARGLEALAVARRHPPDLVILDIVMPGIDGLAVCRRLREDPKLQAIPVLFLTGRDAIAERIEGLDGGGDDYLPKPFDFGELRARVRALLRRTDATRQASSEAEAEKTVVSGPLTLDLHSREVRFEGNAVLLTPTEFDLMYFLMTHPDEAFSSMRLLQQVWGHPPHTGEPSLVRGYMRKLREKIEDDPDDPRFLRTASRHGYIFTPDA